MRAQGIFSVAILCLLASRLPASQDLLQEVPGLRVQIDLNQRTYYINEPVPVRVLVINDSTQPVQFDLGRHLFQNYNFRVRSLNNVGVRERESFQLEQLASRQDLAPGRSITIAPGERFGREIDVSSWLRLVEPGTYEVTGYFLLRPRRSPVDWRYASNSKRFVLQPPRDVAVAMRDERARREDRDGKRLSAGETVDYIIAAKRRSDWNAYFRFLDLERLIMVFTRFRTRYVAAEMAERGTVMEDFRRYLRVFPAEHIEHHFVKNVSLTRDEETLNETAKVECLIVYKTGLLVERKTYHFSLYRKLDRWYVSSYYVINK